MEWGSSAIKKNGRNEQSDLWDPMSVTVALQPESAPGTTKVHCALCSAPLSPLHHLLFGVQTSRTGMKGFLTCSGLTFLGENQFWASVLLPTSPNVSWAEPSSTLHGLLCSYDGAAHCWFVFCTPCDGVAHCWSWPVSCLVKVVWSLLFFCKKKSLFIRLCSQPLAGRPAAY